MTTLSPRAIYDLKDWGKLQSVVHAAPLFTAHSQALNGVALAEQLERLSMAPSSVPPRPPPMPTIPEPPEVVRAASSSSC